MLIDQDWTPGVWIDGLPSGDATDTADALGAFAHHVHDDLLAARDAGRIPARVETTVSASTMPPLWGDTPAVLSLDIRFTGCADPDHAPERDQVTAEARASLDRRAAEHLTPDEIARYAGSLFFVDDHGEPRVSRTCGDAPATTAPWPTCAPNSPPANPPQPSPPFHIEQPQGASTMDTIILGTGVLDWRPHERQSDRYGTVNLSHGAHQARLVVFGDAPLGQRGTLVAVVLDTRRSPHIGDLARGIAPTTPTVGDRITLGTGTLIADSYEAGDAATEIGIVPDDRRESDWLDPEALYRCHHQTVRLELHPEPAEQPATPTAV